MLAIPVWSAFNSWIFNHGGIDNLEEALWYFFLMILIIGFIVFSTWMPLKISFLDDLFHMKSSKVSYEIKALESINFYLKNPNYGKSKKTSVIKQSIINSIVKEDGK